MRAAETGFREQSGERRWTFAVRCQREYAGAGLQMRPYQIERAAMHREQFRLRQRPAEPRRRETERGGCRHNDHFAGIDTARQYRANAVVKRIAGRQYANLPAAMAEYFVGGAGKRRRPWP